MLCIGPYAQVLVFSSIRTEIEHFLDANRPPCCHVPSVVQANLAQDEGLEVQVGSLEIFK